MTIEKVVGDQSYVIVSIEEVPAGMSYVRMTFEKVVGDQSCVIVAIVNVTDD